MVDLHLNHHLVLLHQSKMETPTNSLMVLLMTNAKNATKQTVSELLSRGANVRSFDRMGRGNIISFALFNGASAEVVRVLLDSDTSKVEDNIINVRLNRGMTLLMFAIASVCKKTVIVEIINRMTELRSNINALDDDHNSALIHAARFGQKDVCKLLLDKGADVNLVSNGDLGFEMTALDNALNRDVRQVLKKRGAKCFKDLHSDSAAGCSNPQGPSSPKVGGCYGERARKRDRSTSPPARGSGGTNSTHPTWFTNCCARRV